MSWDDYPEVHYTQYFKVNNSLKPKKYTGSCFSSLDEDAEQVIFHCQVDQELTPDEIEFFLKFMSDILDTTKFSIKYKDIYHIKFKLNTISLNYISSLLYLTFFRYLQEFPDIIKEFFKHKGEDSEELFQSFQHIHFLNKIDKFPIRWENMSGHGLMYDYGNRKFEPINIDIFKQRLKQQEITSVHKYWKS